MHSAGRFCSRPRASFLFKTAIFILNGLVGRESDQPTWLRSARLKNMKPSNATVTGFIFRRTNRCAQ